MADNQDGTGFSADYVKELRSENASWRQKVRDLEAKQVQNDVQVELLKKGIEVNPAWVELQDGETPAGAVDRFLKEYPQFTKDEEVHDEPKPKPNVPKVMKTNSPKSNEPGPNSLSAKGREIEEIKKDPKARSALRSQYRQLLAQNSNREYQGD